MDNIRNHLKKGIAHFDHAQIIDFKRYGVEIIKKDQPVLVDLGKNATRVIPPKDVDVAWNGVVQRGKYFYWYSKRQYKWYSDSNFIWTCVFWVYYYQFFGGYRPDSQGDFLNARTYWR